MSQKWSPIADEEESVELYEQEQAYREATGDKPWSSGFSDRLEAWARQNSKDAGIICSVGGVVDEDVLLGICGGCFEVRDSN